MSFIIAVRSGASSRSVICAHSTSQRVRRDEWPLLEWAGVQTDICLLAGNDNPGGDLPCALIYGLSGRAV